MTTSARRLPRLWCWATGHKDVLHRTRAGSRVTLCGRPIAPGTRASDDIDALGAAPCRTCTRIAHEEIG
jgi:hypothetical protein